MYKASCYAMMILNYYLKWKKNQQNRTRQTQKIHRSWITNCMWAGINIEKVWRIQFLEVNLQSYFLCIKEHKAIKVFQNSNPKWRMIHSSHQKKEKGKILGKEISKCNYHSRIKRKTNSFFRFSWQSPILTV